MVSQFAYGLLILALVAERLVELRISRNNAAWALSRGGVEYGREHFRWMKLLHGGLLSGALAEVWWGGARFAAGLAWPMCLLLALSQALRYWTIFSLGPRWNVRVIVIPGGPAETGGPFRFLRHPNYLAVVVEGVAIPLVHGAVVTALAFSVLNAWLLGVRMRCEERALREHCRDAEQLETRPRLWPRWAKRE